MSYNDDEDLGDLNDAELEKELRELQAIKSAVHGAGGGSKSRRSEPAGGKKGKPSIEQQLLGEIGNDNIDDDDLEAELNALISAEETNEPPRPKQQTKVEEKSSGSSPDMNRTSPEKTPTSVASAGSSKQKVTLLHRCRLDVTPMLLRYQNCLKSLLHPKDVKSQATQLLLKRREAYATNAKLAVEDGNSEYAKECAETVMMFDQALAACEEQEITLEDLSDIPGTPSPYKKKTSEKPPPAQTFEQELLNRIAKFEELADNYEQKEDVGRSRMQRRLAGQLKDALKVHKRGGKIQPDQLPVPLGFDKLPPVAGSVAAVPQPTGMNEVDMFLEKLTLAGPSRLSAPTLPQQRSKTPSPARSEPSPQMQAEMLQAKAVEYKKGGIDSQKERRLASSGKKIENEANELNPPPSSQPLKIDAHTEIQITPSSKLLYNLKHQLEMVMKLRTQFNAIKDIRRTQFYDELIKRCTHDLRICHQEVKSGRDPLMKYKINEINLPTLEINPGMPADVLELKIVSIEDLRMPEGWKPIDAQTFVSYEFPFPHEAHQKGQTQIVYKTESPGIQFNRLQKSLLHVVLNVRNRKKFNETFVEKQDINFADINNQATVHAEQDLLDHRKKTGGKITVEIRVQKPLDDKKMNTTKAYPWIRLADTSIL
ncbi:C2 domain-containing protein [Aphelenchoides bicaudatus]|nr:C2 domain-containing protein [Aphelenchoides bicaudatus]